MEQSGEPTPFLGPEAPPTEVAQRWRMRMVLIFDTKQALLFATQHAFTQAGSGCQGRDVKAKERKMYISKAN